MHSFLCTTLLTEVLLNHHNHPASVPNTKLNKEVIFIDGGGRHGKTFFRIKNDFPSKPRMVAEGFKNINITNLSIPGDKGYVS